MLLEADINIFTGLLMEDTNNIDLFTSLKQSEAERNSILKCEEEMWRLCSRALWLSSGDNNTRYFHKVASHNKTKKHLWEIYSGSTDMIFEQEALKIEATKYFKALYKASVTVNINDQCKVTELFS